MKWIFPRRRVSAIEELQESLAKLQRASAFVSTPWGVVREMLEFAGVGPADTLYDLGSGDGRIPILAAQEFGSKSVGIERDRQLWRYSQRRVSDLGLQQQVRFECGDFFHADLHAATVVSLYLLSAVNGELRSRLASHLKPGSRVVALDFEVPGWRPQQTAVVQSEGNVEYTLHLYVRPAPQLSGGFAEQEVQKTGSVS